MAKRQFTSAQLARLKKLQSQRMERAKNRSIHCEENSAMLGLEQHGILITHHSVMVVVRSDDGRFFDCTLRQNLGPLITGDEVVWQPIDDHTGVVVACQPRKSMILSRSGHGTKPIVANVDLMVIVVALAPLPQMSTIDRYLIMAQSIKLRAIIVINKVDLLSTDVQQALFDRIEVYERLGFRAIKVSTKNRVGIDELKSELRGITSIVVGQSGVGKSSLLNTLVPNCEAQTNSLSHDATFGRQTTSASTLYQLPEGGNLIDSPGIHQFKLTHLSREQILKGFSEFQPYLGTCQFRNCLHKNEPQCALIKAVEAGDIASFRLKNYHELIEHPL